VRALAVRLLANLKFPAQGKGGVKKEPPADLEEVLIEAFRTDPADSVRTEALSQLTRMGSPKAKQITSTEESKPKENAPRP
jgi:hypothetical protein